MLTFEGSQPEYKIFMGDDKYENELLIKYGWPEDVWFHVDEFSSAHIYVRLPEGKTIKDIPEQVIEECCQLTKGNSIEGSKRASVDIVYTPWANLKKEHGSMDVGTVGFVNTKDVKKLRNVAKNKDLLKTLEKTRECVKINFEKERLDRDRRMMQKDKVLRKQAVAQMETKEKEERDAYNLKHYTNLKPTNPTEYTKPSEDDFM